VTRWVYGFGDNIDGKIWNLLGGKGAGLSEMYRLGLPVPPGFTITTNACRYFHANGNRLPAGLDQQVNEALHAIEKEASAQFGDPHNPLLVSVRAGARTSMPGMINTVLDLGINDKTVEGLAKKSGNPRFAYDSYRRFIQMYSDVVLGLDHHHFEDLLELHKENLGLTLDTELAAADWKALIEAYKAKVREELEQPFPQDAHDQLRGAIGAVFRGWMNARAIAYRSLHGIPSDWGVAVSIQSMVFGNMGENCATGIASTRNPSTGENSFCGEYLVNAQGEDVVAGIRPPQYLTLADRKANRSTLPAMEEAMPGIFAELLEVRRKLEAHFRDMQDIEFTVQNGQLWLLQTHTGKRTAKAALKIAVEMVNEGLIEPSDAVRRIDPDSLDQLLHPMLDPRVERKRIARGLPASPGAASGVVVFSAEEAEMRAEKGEAVILVQVETSPEDTHGMHAARGILTSRGGLTSHAAVIARGMGKPCVTGAGEIRMDPAGGKMTAAGVEVKKGKVITIDGGTGEVMLGMVPTVQPQLSQEFADILRWADEIRRLRVRANAETPENARIARAFGAEGIGLCRTEHMFFGAGRIVAMRRMILADTEAGRRQALAMLLPMQRDDFVELFRVMSGCPVTVRLLDPPLHEFLPHGEAELIEVAAELGEDPAEVRQRAARLREVNPMLGHRGCRLGITYPEIYEMQARAIFEAAIEAGRDLRDATVPEIMIPLVATKRECDLMKELVDRVAADVAQEQGVKLRYLVGTMIELPRAALTAGEIAKTMEFFSFGTNDLTQMVYGLSRDDAAPFLRIYQRQGVFESDPFASLDREGVGEIVRIACEKGRAERSDLTLGVCGEHGGDPASIFFFERLGLDYVSCSPYRVPIARLAAAQATLGEKEAGD
jgi:pyruvate,orthophosphate dikinase